MPIDKILAVSREERVVEMRKSGWWPFRKTYRTRTDGNGWFGFATPKPGAYQLRLVRSVGTRERQKAEVVAGKVSRVEFRSHWD